MKGIKTLFFYFIQHNKIELTSGENKARLDFPRKHIEKKKKLHSLQNVRILW